MIQQNVKTYENWALNILLTQTVIHTVFAVAYR
jgi:hypothetical protein